MGPPAHNYNCGYMARTDHTQCTTHTQHATRNTQHTTHNTTLPYRFFNINLRYLHLHLQPSVSSKVRASHVLWQDGCPLHEELTCIVWRTDSTERRRTVLNMQSRRLPNNPGRAARVESGQARATIHAMLSANLHACAISDANMRPHWSPSALVRVHNPTSACACVGRGGAT
jgi:hypothetical protein